MVDRSWGKGKKWITKGSRKFGGDGYFLNHYLDYGDNVKDIFQIHEIIYFKYLWFIAHQLYLTKTVKNSLSSHRPPPTPPPPPKKKKNRREG